MKNGGLFHGETHDREWPGKKPLPEMLWREDDPEKLKAGNEHLLVQIVRAYPRHLSLAAPLFDQYRQFYGKPREAEGARQFVSTRLERGDSILFLAIEGTGSRETGLGFVQLYPIFSSLQMKPAWLLNDLFVVPEARRRGIARALLERARRHALETRACQIVLSTGVDNAPAQTLYEKLGYQRDNGFYTYVLPVS